MTITRDAVHTPFTHAAIPLHCIQRDSLHQSALEGDDAQMTFSGVLLAGTREIREKIRRHPFVVGLRDGTLPVEKFRFYMCQDYVYLVEYCRIFGLAVAKAGDLPTMSRLAQLLHSTLHVEMALHRSYAAQFGITERDLEGTAPAAATHAYTSHLLNVAWGGTLAEIAASLLPCQWGYWELGCEMAEQGGATESNPYRQWIETYSSPEFGELAGWLRGLVDSLAEGARPGDLGRMECAFLASSRYELMFWEMAWRQEGWPA